MFLSCFEESSQIVSRVSVFDDFQPEQAGFRKGFSTVDRTGDCVLPGILLSGSLIPVFLRSDVSNLYASLYLVWAFEHYN